MSAVRQGSLAVTLQSHYIIGVAHYYADSALGKVAIVDGMQAQHIRICVADAGFYNERHSTSKRRPLHGCVLGSPLYGH